MTYDVTHFMNDNWDMLTNDMIQLLRRSSTSEIIKSAFDASHMPSPAEPVRKSNFTTVAENYHVPFETSFLSLTGKG